MGGKYLTGRGGEEGWWWWWWWWWWWYNWPNNLTSIKVCDI